MSYSIHMLRIQINPINFELFNNIKLSFFYKPNETEFSIMYGY